MNLTEATYLLRHLARRRLPAMLATTFTEMGRPDFMVIVNLPDTAEPIDVGELGQALWLVGFRTLLHQGSVLKFEPGPRMRMLPMPDIDADVDVGLADEDDLEDEIAALERDRFTRRYGGFAAEPKAGGPPQ